jgi:hypothetical protein
VESAGLAVLPGTTQKREPPEPDILCQIVGAGKVAFELVEILDEDFAGLVSEQIRLQNALHRAARATPNSETLAPFANALVYVRFRRNVGARRREGAIPALFAFLDGLSSGFVGDVMLPEDLELSGIVKSLRVSRGDYPRGPHFQVEAAQFISNPVVKRLMAKFAKRYSTGHPLELLAFYELHPAGPPELWMSAVRDYVNENIERSQFSRVWIFDAETNLVLFPSEANVP